MRMQIVNAGCVFVLWKDIRLLIKISSQHVNFCETQKGLRKALIVQKGYEAKLKIMSNVADER